LTQASQRRVQDLENERQTTLEAVAEERRRIARELHDIVTHAVTVIVLQAAGAARVRETDFTRVGRQSLANIEIMGKQAMAELRRLLGVLVSSDPTDHAADINFGPQPGLADLPALLISVQASGMSVTVHEEGSRRDLDPSVDLAAYRIAQEGLTNVLKHAGKDGNPQLRLVWGAQSLIITIDNGTTLAGAPRRQALSVGHGLVGLRERAHAVGGYLRAGAHRGVGYRLTATLPFAAPAVPPGVSSTTGPYPCTQGPGDQGKYAHDSSRGSR
jgi:signal transduction histidine kinase